MHFVLDVTEDVSLEKIMMVPLQSRPPSPLKAEYKK
jgi:hypothetical protein